MTGSSAWRSLDAVDRAIYIEMASRYGGPGSNNGRITYSVREAADALRIGKATACRSLRRLFEHGFIVATRKGHFDRKYRHASEWRLTEFGCDVTGGLATKDFMRWQPKTQNPVPIGNRAVSVVEPNGSYGETVVPKRMADDI